MVNKKQGGNGPDYTVGFGKPPKETQFQQGQSGNPKGRPKGRRNVATALQSALNEKVVITENGHRKTITKLDAAFKQVVNKAAGGDTSATKLLVQLFPFLESELADKPPQPSQQADKQVLANLLNRLQQHNQENSSTPSSYDKGTST
jgi:hypothetical protein